MCAYSLKMTSMRRGPEGDGPHWIACFVLVMCVPILLSSLTGLPETAPHVGVSTLSCAVPLLFSVVVWVISLNVAVLCMGRWSKGLFLLLGILLWTLSILTRRILPFCCWVTMEVIRTWF